MGLSYRSIRAAGSALLVAAAVGTGGMTGMASALAVEPVTVPVEGTVVDGAGHPLGGVHLAIVEELAPDGGIAAFSVTTALDGTFGTNLYAWGTTDAPASVTLKTDAGEELTIEGASCSQTWSVSVADVRHLALAEAAPDALTVTATTELLGEVCGTTGTQGDGATSGNAGNGGADGGSTLTPPPTDLQRAVNVGGAERLGPALTLGFVLGLVLATAFLMPLRRSRPRH